MKPLRLAITSMAAIMLAVILVATIFMDDGPQSVLSKLFGWLSFVYLWPLVAYFFISPHNPTWGIVPLLMTGLFWGFIVELIFILKARKRRQDPLPAIPTPPPSP